MSCLVIKGIPITDSHFWQDEAECTLEVLKQVFRSCTDEEMPLLEERLACLREAGTVLYQVCSLLSTVYHFAACFIYSLPMVCATIVGFKQSDVTLLLNNPLQPQKYQCSPVNLIKAAKGSAARLVNLLADDFPCFRDEHRFETRRKPIRILKRAQIFVADVWAAFEGKGYGEFRDIDKITMFADYRVPQILNTMGCIGYSPPLDAIVRDKKEIQSGSNRELQLRGRFEQATFIRALCEHTDKYSTNPACSIWCVELIRREIKKNHPEANVNAILIDFFLYDTIKEMEAEGKESIPHHRTRSIWY